jgi:ParB-like nuclease family protein
MHIKVAIKDLLPNPHRRIEHYPIKREKVDALKESIGTTEFWDNLVGRKKGDKVEIAYGHHRWNALRELYQGTHEIGINVRDFSDTDMLKIMARENMEEWGSSALVEMETVAAVLDAYREGKIELDSPAGKTASREIRYIFHDPKSKPYSPTSVGKFLGWLRPSGQIQDKVYWILNALDLIREGLLNEKQLEGLGTDQARSLILEAHSRKEARERSAKADEQKAEQAKKEAEKAASPAAKEAAIKRHAHHAEQAKSYRTKAKEEAKKVISTFGPKLREGRIGAREVKGEAAALLPSDPRVPPNINTVARKLAEDISDILNGDTASKKLEELIEWRAYLDEDSKIELARELDRLSDRVIDLAKVLRSKPIRNVNHASALQLGNNK